MPDDLLAGLALEKALLRVLSASSEREAIEFIFDSELMASHHDLLRHSEAIKQVRAAARAARFAFRHQTAQSLIEAESAEWRNHEAQRDKWLGQAESYVARAINHLREHWAPQGPQTYSGGFKVRRDPGSTPG
jgi:hypothetical protein